MADTSRFHDNFGDGVPKIGAQLLCPTEIVGTVLKSGEMINMTVKRD